MIDDCNCDRKSRVKRVVRVAAISLKMADIPPDDFSWRKYGQKPIKGSPHPRYILYYLPKFMDSLIWFKITVYYMYEYVNLEWGMKNAGDITNAVVYEDVLLESTWKGRWMIRRC